DYIIPEVHPVVWETVLKDKNPVILCDGGLLESFYSLLYIEALRKIYPDKNISWIGNPKYNYLVHIQNIAEISPSKFDTKLVNEYPTPVFMDADDNFYFNVLLNYKLTFKINNRKSFFKINKEPIIQQIFKNALLDYDKSYFPVFRKYSSFKLDNWLKSNKLSNRTKYVLIFQDDL